MMDFLVRDHTHPCTLGDIFPVDEVLNKLLSTKAIFAALQAHRRNMMAQIGILAVGEDSGNNDKT